MIMEDIDFLINLLNKKTVSNIKEDTQLDTIQKINELPSINNKKCKNSNVNYCESNRQEYIKLPHLKIDKKDYISKYFESKLRYLEFRPFVDSSRVRYIDSGYYFKTVGNECKLVKSLLEDNGFIDTSHDICLNKAEWIIMWSSSSIKPSIYKNLKEYQKVNHFPNSIQLTRKDLLYINICKLKEKSQKKREFDFIPKSYIIPNESKFLCEEMSLMESLWIVKPVGSSRGRGIYITKDFKEIKSVGKTIVSKYISDPFLINGYKFDLRVYVLITSITPLRLYIYDEGFTRFATQKYSIDTENSKFVHLTNYSVNVLSKNYEKNSDLCVSDKGSKWSLSALRSYFLTNKKDWSLIQSKIDDLIIKTIISCEHSMAEAYSSTIKSGCPCFELFGFDILLDSKLNPWLMEVNLSPSLNIDSPIDVKIKGELISEILNIERILPLDLRGKENSLKELKIDTELERNFFMNFKVVNDFKLTNSVREIVWDTLEEKRRLKTFRCLFPSTNSMNYRKYFTIEKPINLFLSFSEYYYKNINFCNKKRGK